MKKVRLKPQVNLAVNLLLIVVLSIAAFFSTLNIYNGIKNNKIGFIMNYKIKNNFDYKVYITDNPYYQVEYLEKDKQYPSTIISNIKYSLGTTYKSSKKTDLEYTYKVTGKMISEAINKDTDNEEIWNKEYKLLEEQSGKVSSNELEINEIVDIDYQTYEKLMEQYKKEFAVSMDAYFRVEYIVKITDTKNNVEKEIKTISNIPLLESTIKMDNTIPESINENIYKNNKFSFSNIGLMVITLIIYASIIFFIIKTCKINFMSGYLIRLNKILKLYDDIIITVEDLPECNDLEVVELKDFESLVDLEQELRKPIMYSKVDESLSVFAIYTSTFVYRYIFDEEEYVWENSD